MSRALGFASARPWSWLGCRVALVSLWLVCSGCSQWLPEMVPFGAVTSPDAKRSLNGLGYHRVMWEAAGARCFTPQVLSPRLNEMDVIVLVGQTFAPPGQAARDWLEQWLAARPGRTVIYFGRDFNAELFYRRETLSQLPAPAQPRGAELLALREAAEFNQRLGQVPDAAYCEWFYLDSQQPEQVVRDFRGRWAAEHPRLTFSGGQWPVHTRLLPPDDPGVQQRASEQYAARQESEPLRPANAPRTAASQGGGASFWHPEELSDAQAFQEALDEAPTSEILLAGQQGPPLLFRLRSPRFPDSQIMIVANGAPLLNGTLVQPLFHRVGELLIDSCLPAERVALLAFDQRGLMISQASEQDARGAGLEMLMVWPLSAITMPAALLGIIVCASLLPILGRPQPLVHSSISDFGLHIEAIGRMLYEGRDLNHARSAIAAYYRQVRGEPPPEWLAALPTEEHPP